MVSTISVLQSYPKNTHKLQGPFLLIAILSFLLFPGVKAAVVDGHVATVQKVYIAYYGRPADPVGLDYWTNRLEAANGNLDEIIDAFGNSPESQALYGTLGNSDKINQIYRQLLGRDSDSAGLDYYTNRLTTGASSHASIMLDILNGSINSDAQTVGNKLTVATEFTEGLDTTEEVSAYNEDNVTTIREWMANITADTDTNQTETNIAVIISGNNAGGTTDGGDQGTDTTDGGDGDTNQQASRPNILLIISDDQGLDASAQYSLTNRPPNTPRIDALANSGLVFDNAWATPGCTTTRSSIITGKYGVNTGVTAIGDSLPVAETILHKYLSQTNATSAYNSSIIGKWHLGGGNPPATEPNDRGVPYYAGILQGSLADYSDWEVTEQGQQFTTTEYSTSKLTDLAINWVGQQGSDPWFLWLAYNAPHTPFHLPPADLQTTNLSGDATDINQNPRDYYLAAIEAMDTEIGNLLDSMPQSVRDNTLVLYVGDNGSPSKVRDRTVYANTTKGTLSEGGLRVPMIASGYGVTRQGEREAALINVTDFFATIADVSGAGISQIHDSVSFKPLFTDGDVSHRNHIYVDFDTGVDADSGYAIKNNQYKYLRFDDGSEALYDLVANPAEDNNLMGSSTAADETAAGLRILAEGIRGEESTTPTIPTTPDTVTDISNAIFTQRSANCADYVQQFTSTVNDVGNATVFNGEVSISTNSSGKCVISSNGIPNHDFNDLTGFPNNVSEQSYLYEIPASPMFAGSTTELLIGTDNGIMLNGAKLDILAAACHGVGNEKIGCGNGNDWRFDPMYENSTFRLDSHNAHTQPTGSYHYHGSPKAMFSDQAVESPLIGFAADGFPIFGTWFNDNGTVRKATSGYRLKSGSRPTTDGAPGGTYDGTFRDDYEYVEGLGDLDECNGMTLTGAYGYYVTDEFPYVMGCFKGTVDPSF